MSTYEEKVAALANAGVPSESHPAIISKVDLLSDKFNSLGIHGEDRLKVLKILWEEWQRSALLSQDLTNFNTIKELEDLNAMFDTRTTEDTLSCHRQSF